MTQQPENQQPVQPLTMKERFYLEILKRGGKLPPGAKMPPIPEGYPALQPAPQPAPAPRVRANPYETFGPGVETGAQAWESNRKKEEKKEENKETKRESGASAGRGRPAPSFNEKRRRHLVTVPLNRFEMTAPDWVVRCPSGAGLLPTGLSMLVGDPGAGKSTLIRALVSSLSTGKGPFPVDKPTATLFLAWEDDVSSGILPHVVACGGDASRVHLLREVRDDHGDTALWTPTPDHIDLLRDYLTGFQEVRLVVVDVLSSLLALGGVDSSGSEEVRRLLDPLHRMGQESGVAVLLLHHQNKRVGEKALVRVAGSVQVTGTARLVWLLASDPADPGLRQLAPVKCNLPGRSRGFAFREVPVGRDEVARLAAKVGTPVPDNLPDYLFRRLEIAEGEPVSAEELLGGLAEPRETVGDRADEWLEATLAGNRGEIAVCALAKLAREQGLGDKALAGAKARLKSAGKIRYQKRDDGWWVLSHHWELIALTNAQFPSPSPGVDL